MSKTLALFVAALAIAGVAATATAQAAVLVRVAGKGADAAGCGTAAAPCRTLQFAHDQVDAGGYVVALDPADFGGVVVTKSITIANESAGAARIQAIAAVDIRAPHATVRLRGMTIESDVGYGIITNARRVDIADCVIKKAAWGVAIFSTEPLQPKERVTLLNTSFLETGWAMSGATGAVFAKNTRVSGLVVLPRVWTSVFEDSIVDGRPGVAWGRDLGAIDLGDALGAVRNSVIRGGSVGIYASARIMLSKSTITGNTLAVQKSRADLPMLQSAGDNVIRGNTDDALGSVTPLALH